MNTLNRLINWYDEQCNGEWEHSSGVSIQSMDNPGWLVKININGTKYVNIDFQEFSKNVSQELKNQAKGLVDPPFTALPPDNESDWCHIYHLNKVITIACSSNNLEYCINYVLDKL